MARTPAGEAFTALVVQAGGLGQLVTAAGETLARHGGQSLARWVVLDALASGPMTVAEVARQRGMARQPVQRIADVLVSEGLASFQPNPRHRRAQLLTLTPPGRRALAEISVQQEAWADANGARIGTDTLERADELLRRIRRLITMPDPPPAGTVRDPSTTTNRRAAQSGSAGRP